VLGGACLILEVQKRVRNINRPNRIRLVDKHGDGWVPVIDTVRCIKTCGKKKKKERKKKNIDL
jgi:hypothetical protein